MNMLTAEKTFAFKGHTGAIYALEKGQFPHLFFSGSGDHLIVEWNLETKSPGNVIANMPGIVYSLKLIPAKNLLIAGQSAGGIHIINLDSKKEERLLAFHQGPVFDLLVSVKNNILISAGGDGNIHFISLDNYNLLKTIHLGIQKIRCLVLDPMEQFLITGCQDGSVANIAMTDFKIVTQWQAHQQGFSVNSGLFIQNGNVLMTGSRDACLNLFDAKNNFSLLQSIPAHNYAIYHITLSPDKKYLATASRDKTVKVWDSESISLLLRLDQKIFGGHVNSVNRLLWSSFSSRLLSASDDRSILEWDIRIQ